MKKTRNGKKIAFLIIIIFIVGYFHSQIYANNTIEKIIDFMEESQKLDKEIIKLMTFELANADENIPKIILKDCDNHLWMFKIYNSSVSVNNSIAVYQLACLFGVNTPCIYEVTIPINGNMVYGSIQTFIDGAETIDDIFPWMLSKNQINSLQRQQILDYFVCNYDVGGDNFLYGKEDIIGIDKDEAFYGIAKSPQELWNKDICFNYYNWLWDSYVKKKVEVDFEISFQLIDYVQSINAKKMEYLLKSFFRGREGFLREIVSHKDRLKLIFEKFYQELADKRGEDVSFQVSVENKGKYAQFVVKMVEKNVLKKRNVLKRLRSKFDRKQKDLEIVFSQKGFDEMMKLEDMSSRNILVSSKNILINLKKLRKDSLNICEKFALSLYINQVENILKEKPLEYFLEEPIKAIIKSHKQIDIFSFEYIMRTSYGLPRKTFSKALEELNQHPQDVLKHLSFIQSILTDKEKKIIFEEYKKQKPIDSIAKFICGLLFDEKKYVNEIEDSFAWKYLGQGLISWSEEEKDNAVQEYQKAITLTIDRIVKFLGYRLLGFIYEHNDQRVRFGKGFDVDNAITNYEEALEIKPDSVEALFNLANLYLIKQLPAKALKIFKEIQKIDSHYATEHFHFENIKKICEYKNEEDCLETVKKNTLSGEHHYVLGLAYAVKKQNELAKKYFDQAREFGYKVDVDLK